MVRLPGLCVRATPALYGGSSAVLLLLAIIFRPAMTSMMTLHMLVHIPLILLAGVLAGYACGVGRQPGDTHGPLRQFAKYNGYGIPGLLFVTFMFAYWMIPRSLDHVLVSETAEWAKFVGLFIAGMLLLDSLRRADKVIKLFFIGNFSWMTAIAGLLYQEHPDRLCNFYLMGDQEMAGIGLVIVAVAVPVLGIWAEYRRLQRSPYDQAAGNAR